MSAEVFIKDDDIDKAVDAQIGKCVDLSQPKSFFLFAGAGSGKTRSVVNCLRDLRKESASQLRLKGQRVGVITYTNAARDEIEERLDHDSLIEVSTIHSFVWSLIKGFNADIRLWLKENLRSDVEKLQGLQIKAKSHTTKTFSDRARSILSKQERLAQLDQIRVFTYNPNGENLGKDSLNHSEVIKIGASFLTDKPTMQRILVNRFPVLLIDESQDTNKLLMESFFAVQKIWEQQFCLGLFGDMMQRIYADGKPDLGRNLPPDWARPAKTINHRSPKRIIRLINKIRAAVDEQEQKPRSDKEDGWVRIFILPSAAEGKPALERKAANHMQTVTGDPEWQNNGVKTLILEHHMAAHRMGFLPMFEPLYKQGTLNIGLLDGSLAGIKFFSDQVLPLIRAQKAGDKFKVAAIVRKFSPLLSKETLKANPEKQSEQILKARKAVEDLLLLWTEGKEPRFVDVLRSVQKTGLFEIPGKLQTIAARSEEEQKAAEESIDSTTEESEEDSSQISAWDKMLISEFAQLEGYIEYIQGCADFDTHQGVKGLQFPRVMVIIDDESARGFLFSYEKLFGVKGKTKTDIEHEQAGEETGIDRTRRLLYVTCSRAQQSLAIVCYSANPQAVKQHVLSEGWFGDDEICMSV